VRVIQTVDHNRRAGVARSATKIGREIMWYLKKLSLIFFVVLLIPVSGVSPGLAKKQEHTGMCVCKKNGNVQATYSETICTELKAHDACNAAKKRCLETNQAACENLGGTLSQSSKTCTVGDKC
jgi:hypothetical protein